MAQGPEDDIQPAADILPDSRSASIGSDAPDSRSASIGSDAETTNPSPGLEQPTEPDLITILIENLLMNADDLDPDLVADLRIFLDERKEEKLMKEERGKN